MYIELGQMMDCPHKIQEYECPDYIVALLRDISDRLGVLMWNENQEEYDSPFDNTGNVFICDTFEVYSFDWNYDKPQAYNFKCGDIEISWYKYLGRGCTINGNWSEKEIVNMYDLCISKILEMEEENENN